MDFEFLSSLTMDWSVRIFRTDAVRYAAIGTLVGFSVASLLNHLRKRIPSDDYELVNIKMNDDGRSGIVDGVVGLIGMFKHL